MKLDLIQNLFLVQLSSIEAFSYVKEYFFAYLSFFHCSLQLSYCSVTFMSVHQDFFLRTPVLSPFPLPTGWPTNITCLRRRPFVNWALLLLVWSSYSHLFLFESGTKKGKSNFFLSNLPPRNRRSRPTTPRRSKEELQPPPPPSPPPASQRGRGRKRQCVSTSTPDRQTEQIKDNRPSNSLQISSIQEDRDFSTTFLNQEHSIPSIPCSNSFQILSNLEEDLSRPPQQYDELPSEEPQSKLITVSAEIRCVDCEYLLQPASTTDDNPPHCGICSYEYQSTDSARRCMMLECMCPPEERFVCAGCANDPDSVCYSRVEN